MRRFHGPRSIQWPGRGCAAAAWPSRPGRASSVVVAVSMLFVDPAFLRDLAWREACQGARRNIFGNDCTGRKPSIVANLDRRIERIVDAGPDVAPDARRRLRLTGLVFEVRSDVAGGDVRILADLGVADVGKVRDLRSRADRGFLHLDEGADLRALADGRPWADEGEWADFDAGRDPHVAADNRERVNGHVGLDLDAGVDPRRLRVDDRDTFEHVCLVDAIAQRGGCGGELDACVDALRRGRVGGDVDRDWLALADEGGD